MPLRFLAPVLLLLSCVGTALPRAHAAPAPLNVVLIVADDLGAHDLGVTGSKAHQTPNLDRLAREGMRFSQAYSACTVCSPSRAALLTGLYPARLKVTDWIKGHAAPKAKLQPPVWTQQLVPDHVTLAERLRASDTGLEPRTTMHLGKWHLGGDGFGPETQGFQSNLGGDHRGQPPSYFSPYGLPRLPDGPRGEYLTDREGEEAARFIAASKERPFFLNYWPYAVHTPLQAPADRIATAAARLASDAGGQSNATYAVMLERLDAAVGRILQTLEQQGLADRTLVIFTSDNGGLVQGAQPPTSNAPLRSGKGSPYEGGHRVPLIIKWPGVTQAGSSSAVPVMGIDLHPTVLEACGLPADAIAKLNLDGVSLAPLLRTPDATLPRNGLMWHYPHYHPGGATPYAALRSGDWKLIQYYESGRHELFRLSDDPSESRDLASQETNQVMVLSRQLAALQGKVNAQWPMPNPGWEPEPIRTPASGTIHLHSRQAFVHGELLRYEPQPFKDTLGWWARASDWAEWILEVTRPGGYELEILHGCGNGSGGSEVAFSIGESKVSFSVQETGGFQNFVWKKLGPLELPAGRQSLQMRALRKPGGAVMDLRELRLVPVAAPPR